MSQSCLRALRVRTMGTATEPKWTGHTAAPLFMFTALAPTILTIRHQLIMGTEGCTTAMATIRFMATTAIMDHAMEHTTDIMMDILDIVVLPGTEHQLLSSAMVSGTALVMALVTLDTLPSPRFDVVHWQDAHFDLLGIIYLIYAYQNVNK